VKTIYNVGMYIRRCYRYKNGKRHAYWALVESVRTARGPRQRVVAYLGELDAAGRMGVLELANGSVGHQGDFFEKVEPEWMEIDAANFKVERVRDFGRPWLGMELLRKLGLIEFLDSVFPQGREDVPWTLASMVLVLLRWYDPSSELRMAEHLYEQSALSDLLGIPAAKINEDRLYRTLDKLLPHKRSLEGFLKDRLGTLFSIEYDLLLYDVTSTYFEGLAAGNPQAKHGYSRDNRGDCKQVCIALVVTREGLPLGYEVFEGNRHDSKTVQEIVTTMEDRYGRADRIWVMDRGMISQENIEFLQKGHRRYILGTPKASLKHFERELLDEDWTAIREGLEVKRCPSPTTDEVFILCRSRDRKAKEKAMHDRFEKRIEEGLTALAASCEKKKQDPIVLARRVGTLLGQNRRASGLFQVDITHNQGRAKVVWSKRETWRTWANLSEGCYLLRSNITDWPAETLWQAYIQLTEAEAAFRIQKSDLAIRPIWHQKEHRVQAHIFVCFLAYVLWKTLGQWCRQAGLGDEPRKVLAELEGIKTMDVILPTRTGVNIRKRRVTCPSDHQAILLHRLGLKLPSRLKIHEM
jgi:transposase